jgi:hypothetical protein
MTSADDAMPPGTDGRRGAENTSHQLDLDDAPLRLEDAQIVLATT